MCISTLYSLFLYSTGITTDSRNCPAGSIFFALKGDSFNGNSFAAQALANGSKYAVIDEPQYGIAGDKRYIIVEDVLTALQKLANHHRNQFKQLKVIGITGTNGKTTTKELVSTVLAKRYHVLYTSGNLNNHIGVPLTLLNLNSQHEIAVIEMGANHPGEIKMLAEIANPDYGLITNVGKAHLEGFGSFEGVISTKKELYDYLLRKKNGVIFIDKDSPYLPVMAEGLEQVTYGTGEELYISGAITGNSPYLNLKWKEQFSEDTYHVNTNLIGDYNFSNVLAAIATGVYFDVAPALVNAALNEYVPQNNRSQFKQTKYNRLIIDAYNANPTSMMAALLNFNKMDAGKKMLIIGDMKELGNESTNEHEKIMRFVDSCEFDKVLLVGEMFGNTSSSYRAFKHVDLLIDYLQQLRPKGYTILIKGSNSMKLHKAAEHL